MTKEEERAFHDKLWNDKKFSAKIYKEYEDWQAEEPDMFPDEDFREEAEIEGKLSKKKSRRECGKYKGRGKFVEKDQ
jgi:hypothetical protein